MENLNEQIRVFNRPVKLGIIFSVEAELIIFVFWGLILYPDGNIVYKFLWAVVFCGVGMGATVGALIQLFVVGRLTNSKAILACALLSVGVLGIGCNLLCLNLDSHFHYFGGVDSPYFFVAGGVILAAVSGSVAGWLIFSTQGRRILDNVGI